MGRKHTPKGQIVLQKVVKLKAVDAALPSGASPEDFAAKFKEMYPEDWVNILRRYETHERQTPRGKGHPMPEPSVSVEYGEALHQNEERIACRPETASFICPRPTKNCRNRSHS